LNTKYKSPNMKLSAALAVLSSVARAQDYDLEDLLAGLNMEDLDLGFDLTPDLFTDQAAGENDAGEAALDSALAASAEEAAEAGVRYFGQAVNTVTTTTTTTPTTVSTNGLGCFKCDQMSMAECAALGQFETCPSGESSMCFIEIREVNQQVNQLCTGCKNTQACHELQQQNFLGGPYHMDQCRPHYIEQTPRIRSPNGQSTCRQCFKQCETSATGGSDGMCFFGHDADFADPNVNTFGSGVNDANGTPFSGNRLIRYDQANLAPNFVGNTNHPLYGYTGGSTIGFGIPTGAKISDMHAGATSIPGNGADTVWNLYFASGADGSGNTGKDHPSTGEMTALSPTGQEERQMAYWGIVGASRSWWASDLVAIQNNVAASILSDKTSLIAV